MSVVYLGLGSNLGDREKNIRSAVEQLNSNGVKVRKLSGIIETHPVGGPPQGLFLNAVARAETAFSPQDLLKICLKIEAGLGRMRTIPSGPRTIDIDILLYDNFLINTPELVIPHPRMKEREFVMRPLREIAPNLLCR